MANLNLISSAPSAPRPAACLPQRELCVGAAGWRSTAWLSATIRAETAWCCVESCGSRSSAWRQAARAPLVSPACTPRSASAAKRFSSSVWTRR